LSVRATAFAIHVLFLYTAAGSGCRLVAAPAFKAVRGTIALPLVGSIPTPSARKVRQVCYYKSLWTADVPRLSAMIKVKGGVR